ncbi:MAG TPA: HEAT repeat domain-containing protein [Oscillatoriales cyanobacterium M59_W2019_021]|nr:HEAT repeat domain-containing protein [Oscillatoriales cyanobacterium M4454_W2019_049]HIK52660.1 HEAT repeat domain-containing protein [Oscillatoriales cyanobacterium M59_W2019_021]
MELHQIKVYLNSSDSQNRLKALTELRKYDAEDAIPLLLQARNDPEFIVRSFVAMGLGRKQSDEAFECLLQMLTGDRDYNVRAEAANSIALYGERSIAPLMTSFERDDHWLVRRSILAAMAEMTAPDALYQICQIGLLDEDLTVRDAAIESMSLLAGSHREADALESLLSFVSADSWRTRYAVARALKSFNAPSAKSALSYLSRDTDHRVVGAALESLVPQEG